MYNEHYKWMDLSLSLSQQPNTSLLQAGAILVDSNNNFLCSAYSGEKEGVSWQPIMLSKLQSLQIENPLSLYLTINTLSPENTFDLSALLCEVPIRHIFVGLPDPALSSYRTDDPILTCCNVTRYPDSLLVRILDLNSSFYNSSPQSLNHAPYYYEMRISHLVMAYLRKCGYPLEPHELSDNKLRLSLAFQLSQKYSISLQTATNLADDALSYAFNYKYGQYCYENDVRSLDSGWKQNFQNIYSKLSHIPLSENEIINVGVGGGLEAISLFSDCPHLSCVDIAPGGLETIRNHLTHASTLLCSADSLFPVPNNSFDLYVSLRTYNSSFFDIEKAIHEANRILRPNATIIISVANGFLDPEHKCIIPGLIIPCTDFVDIYRGIQTATTILSLLQNHGFERTTISPANTEIYISASRSTNSN